jgi:hypothetical protein
MTVQKWSKEAAMGKEIRYVRKTGTELTAEQIERIEAARQFEDEYDEDCPEIDPIKTPELYEALVKATAERNRRVDRILREAAV